ncbi:MAG: Rieske (2Fe-2S) protein, partial [Chthoniobacterales bacterium]|nr:Rieske (2Fe-2S) protein [Chthoniobacterales bacterium]
KFGTRPALLIRHEDGTYTAMSAICTHLGCTVTYEPDQKRVFCPCHSGVYDAVSGKNVAGPPPHPLERYEVEIRDGQIIVRRS